MSVFRRRAFFAFAFVATFALCVALFSPCRAQTKETVRPPDVPVALWVPDRFERAVRYESPEQTYLMAAIVNDATGESTRVCIEGQYLFYAVGFENHVAKLESAETEQGIAVRAKVVSLILKNRAHVFHFKNSDAWATVQPRYTPEMLDRTREQFRAVPAEEIARRFNAKNHLDSNEANALINSAHIADGDGLPYFDTLARVFSERGLYVGRHIAWGRPYVITAGELAKRDKEEREWAEQLRQADEATQRIAAHLRGYKAMIGQYTVTYAFENTHPQKTVKKPPNTTFTLKPKKPCLIDVIHWYDPLTRNGKPRYDWKQFTEVATHLERLARLHPWLKAWKDADSIRTVELFLLGRKPIIDTETEVETFVQPTWSAAGMVGEPYCKLVLREVDDDISGSATVYMPPPFTNETRGLITYCRLLNYPTKTVGDWLDTLKFSSDTKAQVRQCVVVTPNGEWKLVNLPPQTLPSP